MDTRKAAPHTSYLLSQFQRVGLKKTEKLEAFLVGNQQMSSLHSQVSASWKPAASDLCWEVLCFGLPLWTLPEHWAHPAAGAEPRGAAVHGAGLQKVAQQCCACLCSVRGHHTALLCPFCYPGFLQRGSQGMATVTPGKSATAVKNSYSLLFQYRHGKCATKISEQEQEVCIELLSSFPLCSSSSLEEAMLGLWCVITRAGKSEMQLKKK